MSASKDNKRLYYAIGAAVAVAGAGVAIYYFWNKKKHGDSSDDESRSHSHHHERVNRAAHRATDAKAGAAGKARVDSALASIDFARATKLSKEQIGAIWEKYDTNKNGVLDENEVRALVKEVLGQIAQEKSVLTKYMQTMFDENTDASHKHEIHGRLKSLHSDLYHRADGVAKQLMNRLDTNRDKQVSREEFVMAFAQWLEQYHEREIRDYLQPEGPAPQHTPAHKDSHNVSAVVH